MNKEKIANVMLVCILVFLFVTVICGVVHHTHLQKEAYSGWCKYTGNSKQISFSEWKAMNRLKISLDK